MGFPERDKPRKGCVERARHLAASEREGSAEHDGARVQRMRSAWRFAFSGVVGEFRQSSGRKGGFEDGALARMEPVENLFVIQHKSYSQRRSDQIVEWE